MTKQEEIEQGILDLIEDDFDPNCAELHPVELTGRIITYLHSQGVVIKANSPDYDYRDESTGKMYKKANGMFTHIQEPELVAVEPLIEVK